MEADLEAKHSRETVGAASLARRVEARAERVDAPLCPCHLVGEVRRDVERDPFRRSREPGAGGLHPERQLGPSTGSTLPQEATSTKAVCEAEAAVLSVTEIANW